MGARKVLNTPKQTLGSMFHAEKEPHQMALCHDVTTTVKETEGEMRREGETKQSGKSTSPARSLGKNQEEPDTGKTIQVD